MERLGKDIIRNAEREAGRIIRNAEREREKILKEVKERVKDKKERERERVRKTKEHILEKEKIKARMEGKNLILRVKNEILNEIYQEFLKEISHLGKKEREEIYRNLLETAQKSLKMEKVYGKDKTLLKKLVKCEVRESETEGIIAETSDGKERIDLTFPTLLELLKEKTLLKISKILFGEKDGKKAQV